jgi:transposase
MKAVLKAQQVNKSDRNDARGIAQMMRVGLYKPVHVKTLASQQRRMLLTSPNTVHFMIWMAVVNSTGVVGCGARGRSG